MTLTIVGDLLWPSELSDLPPPNLRPRLYFQRIGGGDVSNLRLKKPELKLKPPGISLLLTETPAQAAWQMRTVFGPGSRMWDLSRVVGSISAEDIEAAGFGVIPDPTANFPNHFRLTHAQGAAGFTDPNLTGLSQGFTNTEVP
jgi:hypothetical protein